MKRWIISLGIFLAFQLAVAAGTALVTTDYGTFIPTEKILDADFEMMDGILIQRNDSENRVVLKKQEGGWIVASMDAFPADCEKVGGFFERLAEMKKGWPVATTKGAAERFKVAETDYERKITLSSNGKTIDELFIGTSPTYRKVHMRRAGDDAVYAVDFNVYEAGTKPEDWIDKGVLKHEVSKIARIQLPGFALSRRDGNLIVEGLNEKEEETIAEEADRLARRIADLRIRDVHGPDAQVHVNGDDSHFAYTVTLSSGDTETYVFSKPKDEHYYVLKPSHRKEYFKVDQWVIDGIKEIDRSKLLRKTEKQE
ncbi:MAG TPA: DUF4340 domain-containing protein [Deltaproteobacteria bacterium]|nr:DUF4340 domain-containing protein [Deltaproteobacteria bacterium]